MNLSCYSLARVFFASLLMLWVAAPAHTQPLGPRGKVFTLEELKTLEGKTIGEIRVRVRPIFDNDNPEEMPFLYKTGNALKVPSNQRLIKAEMGLEEGTPFNALAFSEGFRRLRELRYLRQMSAIPVVRGDLVDIELDVQDSWTLIPQVSYSSGDGETKQTVGFVDSNLGGFGKRGELIFRSDRNREAVEGIFQDERVMLSKHRLLLGYFDREDGERQLFDFSLPYRTFADPKSYQIKIDDGDSVGRLFYGGDERYIFGQTIQDYAASYSIAEVAEAPDGKEVSRYYSGLSYVNKRFRQATQKDYDVLDLDPNEVSNDASLVPENRRFVGPTFGFQYAEPRFMTLNYIDRFDRLEDFNLGLNYAATLTLAATAFGSLEDAALFSYNRGKGLKIDDKTFVRGEFGLGGRLVRGGRLEDSLLRAEGRAYRVVGPVWWGKRYLGRHTLAVNSFIDLGNRLDRDREFLVGGDNAIRAYEARTFAGDKRFVFNFEDRIHLYDDLWKVLSLGLVNFIDIGGATFDSTQNLFTEHLYADAGVGLRFGFPRFSGGSVLGADLAFPMRDGPDGSRALEFRLTFGGGQLFDSRLRSERVGPENATVAVGFDR